MFGFSFGDPVKKNLLTADIGNCSLQVLQQKFDTNFIYLKSNKDKKFHSFTEIK